MSEGRTEDGFSREMRRSTRDIHKVSDSLVNAKLAFALSDDGVWSEGLLIFYEIFKYLETHVSPEHLPMEFHRTDSFEKDLYYYLGPDWKESYIRRPAVQKYLDHLEYLNSKNPIILLAYVYHLYMGLLSGGQILQKKRAIAKRINILSSAEDIDNPPGCSVTHFPDETITNLKKRMRSIVDEKAKIFSAEIREDLLRESRKVFELNNEIVRTVRNLNRVTIKKLLMFAFCALISINVLHKIILYINWKFGNFLNLQIEE